MMRITLARPHVARQVSTVPAAVTSAHVLQEGGDLLDS